MNFVYVEYSGDSALEIDEIVYNVFLELRENAYSEGIYDRDDYYDIFGFQKLETAKEFIRRVSELNKDKIEKVELVKCHDCEENLASRFVKFSEVRKDFLCEECYQSLI